MSSVHIQLGDPDHRGRARGGKILVDGHDVAPAVVGFRLTAGVREVPRLDLELHVHDVTTFEAPHVEVLIDSTTTAYLERAGWTPPPGVPSILTRDANGCPCERIVWHERPDGVMVDPDEDHEGEQKTMLGRTVPTCPVHGVNARRADGRG